MTAAAAAVATPKNGTTPHPPPPVPTPPPSQHATRFVPSQLVDIDDIEADPNNPRKDFPKEEMNELTASVALYGVRQPIEVRPAGKKYRIVFGERRWRAAKAAGLKQVPVTVRQLTDLEASDIQLDENLKRADLSPLEVAGGYARQLELGRTMDQVCERAGKKRTQVYAMMQLLQLGDQAKKSLGEGKISTSVAQLVARVPKALQGQALALVEGNSYSAPLTFEAARNELAKLFLVDLKKAPWKLTDEKTPCVAKSCAVCPKRAGNAPDLFPEVKNPDTCTDAESYRKKLHAFTEADVLKAGFKKLLKPDEAPPEKLFWNGGRGPVSQESGFVDPDERCYDDAQSRPYKQLLTPEQREKLIVVALDADGKQRHLIERAGLTRELKKAGLMKERKKGQATAPSSSAKSSSPKEYRPPEPTLDELTDRAVVAACVAAAEKKGITPALLKLLAVNAIRSTEYMLERRGIKGANEYTYSEKDFDKHFGKPKPGELAGILVEAVMLDRAYVGGGASDLEEYAEAFGVNVKKVRDEVRLAEAQKEQAARVEAFEADVKKAVAKQKKTDPLDSPAVAKAKAKKAAAKAKKKGGKAA